MDHLDSDSDEDVNSNEKRHRVASPARCKSCGVDVDRFHPSGTDCRDCAEKRIVQDYPWRAGPVGGEASMHCTGRATPGLSVATGGL